MKLLTIVEGVVDLDCVSAILPSQVIVSGVIVNLGEESRKLIRKALYARDNEKQNERLMLMQKADNVLARVLDGGFGYPTPEQQKSLGDAYLESIGAKIPCGVKIHDHSGDGDTEINS